MPPVARYLLRDVKTLPADAPAAAGADLLAHENVRDVLLVDGEGRLTGLLRELPADATTVGEGAQPVPSPVGVEADAEEALERMRAEGLRRLAVVDGGGRPVGILALSVLEQGLAGA